MPNSYLASLKRPILILSINFLSFDPTIKGAISILYDSISNLKSAPLDKIKADWDDLNFLLYT